MIKPTLLGYVRAALTAPQARSSGVGAFRTAMLRFATREGFTLGQVFVETRTGPPWVALDSLLEATRYDRVAAILIPDRSHLGQDLASQNVTRERIQATVDAPVITMWLGPTS